MKILLLGRIDQRTQATQKSGCVVSSDNGMIGNEIQNIP
jgi:hypothetical protein